MIMNEQALLNLIIWIIILMIPIIPNLWSIWHIFKHDFPTPQDKMTWVLITTFLPVIGGILYIFCGRKKIIRGSKI